MLKHSFLIQRLKKVFPGDKPSLINKLDIGGSSTGLSKEALDMFSSIFRFDYMGSAEYELGAVPKALQQILNNIKSYITKEIIIDYIYKDYRNKDEIKGKHSIWVICPKNEIENVCDVIKHHATTNDYYAKLPYQTKEAVKLSYSLAFPDTCVSCCGWLELNNGYMFFSDKEMFENTCKLFGVTLN